MVLLAKMVGQATLNCHIKSCISLQVAQEAHPALFLHILDQVLTELFLACQKLMKQLKSLLLLHRAYFNSVCEVSHHRLLVPALVVNLGREHFQVK